MSANHYDVIIIGSGAGGGTLAYRLAPSGKRILLLERGDFVPREKQNWDSRAVVGEGRYNNVEPWKDMKGKEFVPGAHYFVGGNTKFYGAALVRLSQQDFGELRHYGGVSRNYMCHTNSVMLALSKCENPTVFQKTFGLNDFYFASKEWDYPMGHISFVGKSDADILAAGAPKIVPGFTLDFMAKHSLDFWMTSEDLPENNRVAVTRDGQIQLNYKPNNEEGHKRLQAKLKSLLKHANCTEEVIHLNAYIGKRIPLAGVAHQNGTMRFGRDSKTCVLDINCKAHDLDNLYVVDASFFPSCGAMNPALTIMANALRVGDHLLERLN